MSFFQCLVLQEFSEKDYSDIVNGWKDKIKRMGSDGNQRWGLFYAEKNTIESFSLLDKWYIKQDSNFL